jgi:hypothetical protein
MENSSPSLPTEAGKIVSIASVQGNLIVACEYRMYQLDGDQFVPMTFVMKEPDSEKKAAEAKRPAGNV